MAEYTWGDFYEMVKDEANKGETLKEVIPHAAYRAIRDLEQNWSYKWNEKLLRFHIEEGVDNPNLLELPSDFKSVIALNLSTTDFVNCYRRLEEQEAGNFTFSRSSEPYGYWNQADKWLWLDGLVAGGTSGFLWYNAFTLKDSMTPEATCGMLKYGVQALLGGTMMNLAAFCREPSWFDSYGKLAEIGIKTLHLADAEDRRSTETGIFGGL